MCERKICIAGTCNEGQCLQYKIPNPTHISGVQGNGICFFIWHSRNGSGARSFHHKKKWNAFCMTMQTLSLSIPFLIPILISTPYPPPHPLPSPRQAESASAQEKKPQTYRPGLINTWWKKLPAKCSRSIGVVNGYEGEGEGSELCTRATLHAANAQFWKGYQRNSDCWHSDNTPWYSFPSCETAGVLREPRELSIYNERCILVGKPFGNILDRTPTISTEPLADRQLSTLHRNVPWRTCERLVGIKTVQTCGQSWQPWPTSCKRGPPTTLTSGWKDLTAQAWARLGNTLFFRWTRSFLQISRKTLEIYR